MNKEPNKKNSLIVGVYPAYDANIKKNLNIE